MRTRASSLSIAAIGVAALAAFAPAAGATAAVRSARSCKPPKYPGQGYFSELTVTNTSCATGGMVAVAYYRCRTRHDLAGRCTSNVLGYRCTERRLASPTEVDGIVTCHKGTATVVHAYEQFTTAG